MSIAPPLERDEARARRRLLGNVSYDVHLALSDDVRERTFSSSTTVRFDCTEPGASTFIELEADSIAEIWLNGVRLDPGDVFDGHRIRLDGLAAQNELRVVDAAARYDGTGVGLHRSQDPADGEVYCYTHFEPYDAHRVYACFDQPNLRAAYRFTVDAPRAWAVLGNTRSAPSPVPGRPDLVRNTFAASETEPTPRIATYLTALAAGPYERITTTHRGIELGIWVRRSLLPHMTAEQVDDIFEETRRGLDFFESFFGRPYPFSKYDQAFVAEFNHGAMENPGCVFFNESYIFRGRATEQDRFRRSSTIRHEMVHMWFGDLVTPDEWSDLFLNESFAAFLSYFSMTKDGRWRDSAWLAFNFDEKRGGMVADQLPTSHPVAGDAPDTDAARASFDGLTYNKGASALRQLLAVVGEAAFTRGLQRYIRENAGGNATRDDFLRAIGTEAGRDLRPWWRNWFETVGINTIRADVRRHRGVIRSVTLRQEPGRQNALLRPHRVRVGLYRRDAGGLLRCVARREVDVTGAVTPVPDVAGVRADLVLVNDGDLTFAKTPLDPDSLAAWLHGGVVADPLARQLTDAAAWDVVRDGALPAREWAGTALRRLGAERDAGALDRLLKMVQRADARGLPSSDDAYSYVHPSHRAALRRALAEAARAELVHEPPGTDRQLALARTFIENTDTGAGLAMLHNGLLRGRLAPGLPLDAPMRWQILRRLVATGRAGESAVAGELRRDHSDFGEREAARIRAAMPTPEAKAAAWDQVERSDHLAMLRAIAAGFHERGQDHLTAPYLERYVEAVPRWWRERDAEVAAALTQRMFPPNAGSDASVDAADRLLARADLPREARRIVAEQRDIALRQRAAQRRDLAAPRRALDPRSGPRLAA